MEGSTQLTPSSEVGAVGPSVGDVVGEEVGSLVGDFVGEGVVVPGQSVSHDLIHSFSGSHHEYPADGIHPFSSRSLPGRMGESVGAADGQSVSKGRMHSSNEGHHE